MEEIENEEIIEENEEGYPQDMEVEREGIEHFETLDDRKTPLFVRKFGDKGITLRPYGIAFDLSERIYVADERKQCIIVFDPVGSYLHSIGKYGVGEVEFNKPNLLICRTINGIKRKTYDYIYANVLELSRWPSGLLPICLAYLGNECLYVGDSGNDRIQIITVDGESVGKWGAPGKGDGKFDLISGIDTDVKGNVYVSDWHNRNVQVFSELGTFINCIITFPMSGTLSLCGLRISEDGYIHLNDQSRGHILRYDLNGKLIETWAHVEQVSILALDNERKHIYISDYWTSNITQLDWNGEVVDIYKVPDMDYPKSMILGPNRCLYIANSDAGGIFVMGLK